MKDMARLADQWKTHKYKKPVRGAIILNESMTKVRHVHGSSWQDGNRSLFEWLVAVLHSVFLFRDILHQHHGDFLREKWKQERMMWMLLYVR